MSLPNHRKITLHNNQRVLRSYWTVIGAFIAFAIAFHFLYRYSKLVRNFPALRYVRRITLKVSIFGPSNGHIILIVAFLSLNIVTCLLYVTPSRPLEGIARRFGWVTMFNMPLLFFLAFKNTPFLWLMNQDYKKLNIFHQVVGWTTIIEATLHTCLSVLSLYEEDRTEELWTYSQIAAWVAYFFWLVLSMTSIKAFRSRYYEVFYFVHVVAIFGSLIPLIYHKKSLPNWIYGILSGWAADRIVRLARTHLVKVTFMRIEGDIVKVEVDGSHSWKTGQHVFLTIPSIKYGQSHPYSIAAQKSNSMRFFVRSIGPGGFSSKLNLSENSEACTALIQVPYGAVPSLYRYDEVIFVTGGTGATWTVPLLKDYIARSSCDEKKILKGTFIWSVRSKECLTWFSDDLIEASEAGIDIRLFNTQKNFSPLSSMEEKEDFIGGSRFAVSQGRPNIGLLLADILSKANSVSVAVVVCGTSGMIDDSRFAVSESIVVVNPHVDLFIEEYKI